MGNGSMRQHPDKEPPIGIQNSKTFQQPEAGFQLTLNKKVYYFSENRHHS